MGLDPGAARAPCGPRGRASSGRSSSTTPTQPARHASTPSTRGSGAWWSGTRFDVTGRSYRRRRPGARVGPCGRGRSRADERAP
ncbi:hypothetical protein BJF88_15430 [Cellulosimicrobium sp. CUA-896]|nr:hypothetical protein BJF88_15430 [Cellulosimicrobium sp. CUA-896]